MFKLSKESKKTFFALLPIPLIWMLINHFGFLDYLKTKSVDFRLVYRGEVRQSELADSNDLILVEGNRSIPRVPKVAYVNFDGETLEMEGVGERPWDRAFFRDTALALIERGNARSLAFDFGFTPKSTSRMVPKQNSYRSDLAMGELVRKYPEKVVLGCLYSGVQTAFVKPTGASAYPPFFKDGYVSAAGQHHYPESPSYPLLSFDNGSYLGRVGSFTVTPYRAVDEIPRWVPLWYDAGGKAHAYNLLGGKQSVLAFELPAGNEARILELEKKATQALEPRAGIAAALKKLELQLQEVNEFRFSQQEDLSRLSGLSAEVDELEEAIENFTATLKANPSLEQIIEPQIKMRQLKLDQILRGLLQPEKDDQTFQSLPDLESELERISSEIANFQNTLLENPALEAIIKPQIDLRLQRRGELRSLERRKEEDASTPLTKQMRKEAKTSLGQQVDLLEEAIARSVSQLAGIAPKIEDRRQELARVDGLEASIREEISRLSGQWGAELWETEDSLRLIYRGSAEDGGKGDLVDSFPNEVPLFKEGKVFALGVEALLAYYGLTDEAVQISDDMLTLRIVHPKAGILVESPLSEGQFLEVNWFSKWSEPVPEEILTLDAKRAYADNRMDEYLALAPRIIRLLLQRVNGFDVPVADADLPDSLARLGVDSEEVETARRLIDADSKQTDPPSFEKFLSLVDGINYYYVLPEISSSFNPMCGMKDVLQYAEFQDQVASTIEEVIVKTDALKGESFLGKVERALVEDPQNPSLSQKKQEILKAIADNEGILKEKLQEKEVIDEFFSRFNDAIVLIGPEEKTFQDLAPTPFDSSPVPKVSVHGNLIKTMASGEYLRRLPIEADHLATIIVSLLMALLAVYQGNHASWVQAGGILLLAGYVFFGFEAFSQSLLILPISSPACAGLSTSFVGLAAMVVIEQKAKGRLKGMFGSYVSSDLVEQMVASGEEPSLGGEETAITAFFSDVQSFSSFSELLTPTGLVDLMNEYLTAMTNILQEQRGTLDKYIGDAIVAMYGAPIPMHDHAYQAVKTAILMQRKQIELREKWVHEAEKWGRCHGLVSQMQTRIGCNTGTATVGNMGALDRFNYTMMGDMVNLAARCESGAKAYGAYIMVTEETKLASEATRDDIAFRYLDKIVVKGRSQPVAMFEPTGFMSELTQETQDCLDCFRQGIEKYLLQDWDHALELFEKARELEPNKPGVTPGVKDNPSMILIDRCKVMKENPPGDDWDGVYVMTTK